MSFVEGSRGRRFSQLYMTQGVLTRDSDRMRRRLAAIWPTQCGERVATLISKRLGGDVRVVGGRYAWSHYFQKAPLPDVLDAITFAAEASGSDNFLEQVATIFLEENVGYRVDQRGVVHFAVDAEYERSVQSIISGLDNPRYNNALKAFERIQIELDKEPPDGKLAVRAVFDAVEGLFRLMFPRAPRLASGEIEKHLMVLVKSRSKSDAEQRATAQWVASFKAWVEACHFYRHEQGQEEPHAPPLDLAVGLISAGAAFLRWLVSHDLVAGGDAGK